MPDDRYFTQRMLLDNARNRGAVYAYVAEMGWRVVLQEGDPEKRQNFRADFDAASGAMVHYVEDFTSRQRYVYVSSAVELAATMLASLVEDDLGTLSLKQLLHACDNTDGLEHGRALMRLGVGAPYDYSPEVFSRISAGMRHDDARVRQLSAWATSYSPWPQYVPLIRTIAESDPDAALRDRAATILSVFEDHGLTG